MALPLLLGAAATAAPFLMGGGKGPKMKRVNALTAGQKQVLGYAGDQAQNFDTTYQGNAPGFFEQNIQNPMQAQYQSTIRGLQASPERHSSSRRAQEYGAQRSFTTELGRARADWLNQERLRQMQAAEAAKGRQLGYTQATLGTKAFDTMVTQPKPGMMDKLGQGLGLASSVLSLYGGGQKQGWWGGGNPQDPYQNFAASRPTPA